MSLRARRVSAGVLLVVLGLTYNAWSTALYWFVYGVAEGMSRSVH